MDRTIRWGFIGCGAVTEVKSGPAYQQAEDFEVVAVTRRDRDRAEDYAERHGIPDVYDSPDALIHSAKVDAVYIATPPDSHFEYGMAVAKAGKPCCIEKPITSSYLQARQLCEAFEQVKMPLFVAYYRRSLPRFNQVKQWLQQGKIGEVRHVDWTLMRPPNRFDVSGEPNWRTDPAVAPGGYFEDIGSHGVDLLCYLLGDIQYVSGFGLNQQGRYRAKDAFVASWRHDHTGITVTGSGRWNFGCSDYLDRVEIFGSDGVIRFSVLGEQPLELEGKHECIQKVIENPTHIQQFHVENMSKHLRDGLKHPSTGHTAAHTTWVMEQIVRGTGGQYWSG